MFLFKSVLKIPLRLISKRRSEFMQLRYFNFSLSFFKALKSQDPTIPIMQLNSIF